MLSRQIHTKWCWLKYKILLEKKKIGEQWTWPADRQTDRQTDRPNKLTAELYFMINQRTWWIIVIMPKSRL